MTDNLSSQHFLFLVIKCKKATSKLIRQHYGCIRFTTTIIPSTNQLMSAMEFPRPADESRPLRDGEAESAKPQNGKASKSPVGSPGGQQSVEQKPSSPPSNSAQSGPETTKSPDHEPREQAKPLPTVHEEPYDASGESDDNSDADFEIDDNPPYDFEASSRSIMTDLANFIILGIEAMDSLHPESSQYSKKKDEVEEFERLLISLVRKSKTPQIELPETVQALLLDMGHKNVDTGEIRTTGNPGPSMGSQGDTIIRKRPSSSMLEADWDPQRPALRRARFVDRRQLC
jgi:hypothetical protein